MHRSFRNSTLFLILIIAITLPFTARADDPSPNLKYTGWSNFKIGSSSTVEADLTVQGNKIHITMTRTLKSIDADKAVVTVKSSVNVMGHDHDAPERIETIPARGNPETFTQTGDKEIQAMGKTFKCKVYQTTGDQKSAADHTNPTGAMDHMKANVYVSDQVPGGLVRLEGIQQTGQEMTFILTAMDAK